MQEESMRVSDGTEVRECHDVTPSEWTARNRVLLPGASAEPGPFRLERTPYMNEILDALGPSQPAERVVLMGGGQMGRSEVGNNWIGSMMDLSPGPMLVVQPTVSVAKLYSRERIKPMILSTSRLARLAVESRPRTGGNQLLDIDFNGGKLKIAGANSAVSLGSSPIEYLFLDEIDAYPLNVGGLGDPVALAEARTATFPRRKIYATSAPTLKGLSRIEDLYLSSDQRRYFVPCPHCTAFDWIRWSSIYFRDDDPGTAALECANCREMIEERHKTWMMAKENGAHWRPTATGDGHTVGYHLSALYSPLGWCSWRTIVAEYLRAKSNPQKLKVWMNIRLAETWEQCFEAAGDGDPVA